MASAETMMGAGVHVVCPSCGAVNRVAVERPAEAAVCGRCRGRLFGAGPVAVDAESFDRHLSRNGIPVLVDFWAPWCGPCRVMGPAFAEAAGRLEPRVRLLKLNVDEVPAVAARFGVQSIPTLILFRDGEVAGRMAGAMDAARIAAWTERHLSRA